MDYNLLQEELNKIHSLIGFDYFEAFFLTWGVPRATMDRIKADKKFDVNAGAFVSNKAFFMSTQIENLYSEFSILQRNGLKGIATRLIIIENYHSILAYDNVTQETVVLEKVDVSKNYEFFFPLIGKEKNTTNAYDPISINIAEVFANIYNELMILNGVEKEPEVQNFICYLSYLSYIDSRGKISGEINYIPYILKTFGEEIGIKEILLDVLGIISHNNELPKTRMNYRVSWRDEFVSLWTFREIKIPQKLLGKIINVLDFDWSNVQPEIFGALLQESMSNKAVPSCYTTNDNIHKVIGPLFIDELFETYEKSKGDNKKLSELSNRIQQIHLLDPACGAGNFLIFAFKKLSTLCDIIQKTSCDTIKCNFPIENIHGIDNNSLAVQIAIISFYIAVTQQTKELKPLMAYKSSLDLVNENPLTTDWEANISNCAELYIFGNPPYKGAKKMSQSQIKDMMHVLGEEKGLKELDYAASWFIKAARIFRYKKGAFSFVTTNSLTQGQQVALLWPLIYEQGCYIQFAYQAFKWKNDAKNNTAVTVVIIGVRPIEANIPCELFSEDKRIIIDSISPYLSKGNVIVYKRTRPISQLPYMDKGNMPYDQGNLLLSPLEYKELVKDYPESIKYLRRVVGSDEFINGIERWCLWITNDLLDGALSIPPIRERIEKCKNFRSQLKDAAGKKLALRPHQFRETRETTFYSLVVPSVSSERREYIPIGFIDRNTIVTNLSFVVYDCEPWLFAVVSSRMHNLWVRTVCGGLETRLRYSSQLGYNTFPFPNIDENQKDVLKKCVYDILAERELESQKTLAEIYDPEKMSVGLKYAHHLLDAAVEKCYRATPFVSDQDRLDYLFDYYKHLLENK